MPRRCWFDQWRLVLRRAGHLTGEQVQRLIPTLDQISQEYVLVQAWKKAASYIRYHNWFSDTLELDRAAANLPNFISRLSERLRSGQYETDELKLVPAPKSQRWHLDAEGLWKPIRSGPVKTRPLAHVSLADQVAATALLLCLTAQNEKVLVWSFYTQSISAIVERYKAHGAMRYDGQVTDVDTRRETVRRFQEDDESMVLVANPAAAGAGLTLHRARFAVYESLSNQAAHYLQSLDRIHRRGQTRDVEYLVLLCDKTLELQEYERLVTKEVAAQSLLGDVVTAPMTRETFLKEARAAAELLTGDH